MLNSKLNKITLAISNWRWVKFNQSKPLTLANSTVVSQSTNQRTNEPTNQRTNEPTNKRINGWTMPLINIDITIFQNAPAPPPTSQVVHLTLTILQSDIECL